MNSNKRLLLLVALVAMALLVGTTLVWADGETQESASEELEQGPPDIFAPPARAEAPNIAPAPFTLLTPIKRLLSGPLWLMAADLDAGSTSVRAGGKRGNVARPGFAWESLQEVFTAPRIPEFSAPAAPPSQALVPFRDPAPSFSRDILVTRDFSNVPLQTEPHLAVNPNDPEHLLLGTIDYNFPNNSAYVSIDGGVTWDGPNQPQFLRDDLASAGDPIVGFDRQGNAFFGFISLGVEEFTVGPAVDFALVSSIAVARSEDGGFTWSESASAARSGLDRDVFIDSAGKTRGEVSLSFLDKPWMAIGPQKDNPSKDSIYITYTEFAERFGIFSIGELPFFGVPVVETTIRLVHSEDGGRSWSDPIPVSPTVRRVYGDNPEAAETELQEDQVEREVVGFKRTVQGSQPAVAADGTVYVTWMDSTDDEAFEGLAEIYVASSTDGGKSFSKPVRASVFNEPGFAPRNSFFRYWGSVFPQITVGLQEEVYVAYTALPPDKKNDDGDIYVVRSLDGGKTWSRSMRVNDDDTDRLQFFPSITTDPTGAVHAMWGDMRDDPASTRYHIYYSRSDDKGTTWGFVDEELGLRTQNARITDFPSNPNKGFPGGQFIGDYFSIKATEDDVYMVWADTRLGEYGPVNQKIGFSRRTAIQAPEVFISPPAGSGGEPVSLQGFNFQPDTNVFIQVGGVLVSTLRSNDQGRFTTELFIPISGKGAHSVVVLDDSGNVAVSSFFMEFGFDTVQEMQRDLTRQLQTLEESVGTLPVGVGESLREELEKFRQALEAAIVPPATSETMEVSSAAESGGAAWWFFALSVAGAGLVGSGATLGLSRLLARKEETPRRWDTLP